MASTWRTATNLFRSAANTLGGSSSNNLQPGTLLSVGSMRVQVIKQLAEGGFAFVYSVKDIQTEQIHALKRLLVNDSEDLAKVKEEIEFMKNIPRHRNIVEFRTAGTAQGTTGTEVLIIMEFCPEPSLYEILDRRFKNYFAEPEVLEIFSHVCEGVAHLHSLSPPIAHRDLKVENVLKHGNTYKLCDFGSATTKTFLPSNSSTINRIEDELNRYTTAAYRSPEMVDLWRMQLINEKVDIWALGCLLYRICFFVHPFDEGGSLQILNVNYEIPSNSPYTQELHKFIQFMIEPDPEKRPTIYQVMDQLSNLRGVPNTTRSPASTRAPQTNSSPKRTTTAPKPTTTQPMDAFAMLDWHDSAASVGRSNSGPRAETSAAKPVQVAPVDNFADFSNANFVSAVPATGAQLHQETSFFAAPEAQEQLKSNSPVVSAPSSPFRSSTDNLMTASTTTPPQSPVSQMKPVQPKVDIRSSFSSLTNTSTPPPAGLKSASQNSFNSSDLFADFQSSPSPANNTAFTDFQAPTNQNSFNYAFGDSSSFGSGNMNSVSGNLNSAHLNSYSTNNLHMGMNQTNSLSNSMNMPMNGPMNPLNNSMNAPMTSSAHLPSQHTRHASYGTQGHPTRSLFDSVAATNSSPSISRKQNPSPSGDMFANLRNLM